MSDFTPEWLSLREPADAAARSADVAAEVSGRMAGRECVRVLDLATGTGANLRCLAPQLPSPQRWLVVDRDVDLLAHVPRRVSSWALGRACTVAKACSERGHDREQREQARRGAGACPIRPLPLRLEAEMIPGLTEGDLHLPALDEPAPDLQRIAPWSGAQQRLRFEPALRIAQPHPSMPVASIRSRRDHRPGRRRRGIGTTGSPAWRQTAAVAEQNSKVRSPSPYQPGTVARTQRVPPAARRSARFGRRAPLVRGRPPDRSWLAWRCRLVEGRVQPQAGDADQPVAGESREEVQGGEAAAAKQHDLAPGQPARVGLAGHDEAVHERIPWHVKQCLGRDLRSQQDGFRREQTGHPFERETFAR